MQELALAVCVVVVATPALATESVYGRWAADLTGCATDSTAMPALVVTTSAVRWPDTVCTIGRSYRIRDAVHIGARCADAATEIAIRLQMHGERLLFESGGGQAELRRCP